jgi:dihydroxy-acid dehydratase
VIRTVANAIYSEGALAVLKGNLAPDGCVIKPSACDSRFFKHSGPALVFDDYPSMKEAIDKEDLDVSADHVLVLRNAGPLGGPGMPEWGMLPIPTKLVRQGVRDMLRLSDARMSGTSYGACVLHVAPESYIGGPLALVRTGDIISVDIAARRIHVEIPEEELARRKAAWRRPASSSSAVMVGCSRAISVIQTKAAILIRAAIWRRLANRTYFRCVVCACGVSAAWFCLQALT